MLDDANVREAALWQLTERCGDGGDRDCNSIIYYIETLEEIVRHLASGEPQFTQNQREILQLLMEK